MSVISRIKSRYLFLVCHSIKIWLLSENRAWWVITNKINSSVPLVLKMLWFSLGSLLPFFCCANQSLLNDPISNAKKDDEYLSIYESYQLKTIPVSPNITSIGIVIQDFSNEQAELIPLKFPNLKEIEFSNRIVMSRSGLKAIARCEQLESLTIHWEHNVFFQDLVVLQELHSLKRLYLKLIDGYIDSPEDVRHVVTSIPNLTYLFLSQCRFSPNAFVELSAFPAIQELELHAITVSDDGSGFDPYASLLKQKTLVRLEVSSELMDEYFFAIESNRINVADQTYYSDRPLHLVIFAAKYREKEYFERFKTWLPPHFEVRN